MPLFIHLISPPFCLSFMKKPIIFGFIKVFWKIGINICKAIKRNHGYEPQSKLRKQIPQQAAGYYTLRCAGLFNLPIPLRLRNWSFTINSKTNQKYSGYKRDKPSYFFIDDLFAPMQCASQREHPKKTTQQNSKTGEKRGYICLSVCLGGQERTENSHLFIP
jgi:hypothetical protein